MPEVEVPRREEVVGGAVTELDPVGHKRAETVGEFAVLQVGAVEALRFRDLHPRADRLGEHPPLAAHVLPHATERVTAAHRLSLFGSPLDGDGRACSRCEHRRPDHPSPVRRRGVVSVAVERVVVAVSERVVPDRVGGHDVDVRFLAVALRDPDPGAYVFNRRLVERAAGSMFSFGHQVVRSARGWSVWPSRPHSTS